MFWNGGAIWGTLDVLFGVDEFEDEFFLRGVECNIPKKVAKGLSSVRGCGERVVGRWVQSQETSEASFLSPTKTLGGHPFFSLHPPSWPPPPFLPLGWTPPPPMAAIIHCFLPQDLPLRSKDREKEGHVELKRKRGSRRCSSPSLLEDFLGKP